MEKCNNIKIRICGTPNSKEALSTYKTVILDTNIREGRNRLTQSMISTENTKYVITWNYILDENIIIPEGCILDFDGGSIDSDTGNRHNITGQDTVLLYNIDKSLVLKDVGLYGTFIDNRGVLLLITEEILLI